MFSFSVDLTEGARTSRQGRAKPPQNGLACACFTLAVHDWLDPYLNRDVIKLVPIQTYAPSRGAGFSYFLWLWS